ncbi:hypothetical protein MIND_00105200 [Mycena indigotica]|uniref:DUF7918 domain-containing protein n=1 Tax=Mycena indigotica TaxID=2126181 RepID=A0A8H6WGI8_9AGAR|nr:uncharacterized protein MIND_00105200 [Mycena indigotica]KAF7315886.1 hypothetical protein MIND_00105200 [Mycena indigotica]
MPEWRDLFRAWIQIDGVDAEEYGVEVDEAERVVSSWIGSEVGKTFSVEWDILSDNCASPFRGKVLVDGIPCAARSFDYETKSRVFPVHRNFVGVQREATIEPFMFGTLTLSDDDALLATEPNLADLGVIELKVTPVLLGKIIARREAPVVLPSLNIHERSKKVVTQQVRLGAPKKIAPRGVQKCTIIGPDLVTFRFKYRPMEILRASGIAPALKRKTSAPPSRSESAHAEPEQAGDGDSDVDQLEVKRLEEQLLAAKARVAAKKLDKKPRIKRESGITSIDLTQPAAKRVGMITSLPDTEHARYLISPLRCFFSFLRRAGRRPMLEWRGQFRAWIKIEGVDAEEYGVEVDEGERIVSCWIGSEVERSFTVEWDILPHNTSQLCGTVYMDGVRCSGKYYFGDRVPVHHTYVGVAREDTIEPFVFGALTLSDDDELLSAGPNVSELGVIELKVLPVRVQRMLSTPQGGATLPALKIHERSKKAVTQQVQLGVPLAASNLFSRSTPIGPELVTFRFKYRPTGIRKSCAPTGLRRL